MMHSSIYIYIFIMGKRASSYVNPVSKINIVIFYHIRRQIIIPYPNHLSFDPTEITGGGVASDLRPPPKWEGGKYRG